MKTLAIPFHWLGWAGTWSAAVLVKAAAELKSMGLTPNEATKDDVHQVIADCKLIESINAKGKIRL